MIHTLVDLSGPICYIETSAYYLNSTLSGFHETNYLQKQNDKIFNIIFGGNLDLYWNIISLHHDEKNYRKASTATFIITTKEFIICLVEKNLTYNFVKNEIGYSDEGPKFIAYK